MNIAKALERAMRQAFKNQHLNTRIGVLHVDAKEVRGVLILRPDQDWMTTRLREFNIPYIVATEIWPPLPEHNPILAPQTKRFDFGDKKAQAQAGTLTPQEYKTRRYKRLARKFSVLPEDSPSRENVKREMAKLLDELQEIEAQPVQTRSVR